MTWRGLELDWDGVLKPYPEASALVDFVATFGPFQSAVDIGTGSGCIALALKSEGIADHVVATDIDETACTVARQNANRLGIDLDVRLGDMYEPVPEQYDLTVFNAPYARTADALTLPDPAIAVDGGEDGLVLIRRAVAGFSGGMLALGVGVGHHRIVIKMFEAVGLELVAKSRCPRFGIIRHLMCERR